MIVVSIDVTKINKEYIVVGKKGKYIDLILRETPNSDYGDDYLVVQSIPKEERIAGKTSPIIGNARHINRPGVAPTSPADPKPKEDPSAPLHEDVPF